MPPALVVTGTEPMEAPLNCVFNSTINASKGSSIDRSGTAFTVGEGTPEATSHERQVDDPRRPVRKLQLRVGVSMPVWCKVDKWFL